MKECCNSKNVHENIIELVEKYGYKMDLDRRKNTERDVDYFVKIPTSLEKDKNFLSELIDLEIETINYKPKNLNEGHYNGYTTWQGSHWSITNIKEVFDKSPEILEKKFSRLLNETNVSGWYIVLYEFSAKGFKQIEKRDRVLKKWSNITEGYEGEKIKELIFSA